MATRARSGQRGLQERALASLGGPGRARIVLVLAAILGLSGADAASVSATAGTGAGQSLSSANAAGPEYTFLLFLLPLMGAGLLALAGLRTYPRDVATARASMRAQSRLRQQQIHEEKLQDRYIDGVLITRNVLPLQFPQLGGTVLASQRRGRCGE